MSTKHTCPNCQHTWTPSKAPAKAKGAGAELAPPDLAALSDAELFAYRKRTGPQEDARFFLRTQPVTFELACRINLLIDRNPPRAQFLRELYAVQVAHWRGVPYARFTYEEERGTVQAEREAAYQATQGERFIECGSCGAYHREGFTGDCRDDDERFHELPEGAIVVWGEDEAEEREESEGNPRTKGDDDGHDYSDPGDAKAGYEDYYGID